MDSRSSNLPTLPLSNIVLPSKIDATAPVLRVLELFAWPTATEVQGCWELCRLHNNIGFWVVWIPTAWSIAMSYHAQPHLSAVDCMLKAALFVPLCFGIKSLIMTIDDILDYDIDALVERTKGRPIPRGAISLQRAWLFFALQVVVGVYLANTVLSTSSLHASMWAWPLYIIYPTCKRWMNFAPIPLGFMFAIGIFMGWSELSRDGTVPYNVLIPVYISCVFWTIAYETVYQHQDKVDDTKIGLHSPALWCAEQTIPICTASAVLFFSLLAYGGWVNNHGTPFFVAVLSAALYMVPVLMRTSIDKPDECKALFLGTPRVGQIILAGFIVDAVSQRLMAGISL